MAVREVLDSYLEQHLTRDADAAMLEDIEGAALVEVDCVAIADGDLTFWFADHWTAGGGIEHLRVEDTTEIHAWDVRRADLEFGRYQAHRSRCEVGAAMMLVLVVRRRSRVKSRPAL